MLIRNIKTLVGVHEKPPALLRGAEMKMLPCVDNAFLLIENGCIKDWGSMDNCPDRADEVLDATGRLVLPAWCDSHTHLVFAASRESEFIDKIQGVPYEEIARKGGGILNSARRLRLMPQDELLDLAWQRLQTVIGTGTGAIEIKSGYGLSVESELKMLRVVRQLKERSPIPIKATFLGAHALPTEFKENRIGYIDLIINEMLPTIAHEGLADYIDVFCEKGFYSVAETEQIMTAGERYGLKAKIHTNQFNSLGAIELCTQRRALSVDHLEVLTDNEIEALAQSATIATLLPSASFFLNMHYPPARKMLDAGLPLALASDYNPGTSPSGKMAFVVTLACIYMKMLPEEAINAATLNGAYALELSGELGSVSKGKRANLILTRPIPSLAYIPYAFGEQIVERTLINGK
jgi:imidazolonepropionase